MDLSEEAQKYIKALEQFSIAKIRYPIIPPGACHQCNDWIDEFDFYWRPFPDQIICERCLNHLLDETRKGWLQKKLKEWSNKKSKDINEH